MSSNKPIRIYRYNYGDLIPGVNTSYRLFCFFNLFPMVGKGLSSCFELIIINKFTFSLKGYKHNFY